METTNYLILGFAVIFGTLFLHLLSIYLRNRNFQRDLEILEELQKTPKRKTAKGRKKGARR